MTVKSLNNINLVLRKTKTILIKIFTVSLCILIFYGVSLSQFHMSEGPDNKHGVVQGYISDYSNAVFQDANVIIEGTRNYKVTTSDEGSYSIKLPAGEYRIRVEVPNFRRAERSSVFVESNSTARIDFTLFDENSVFLSYQDISKEEVLDDAPSGAFTFEKIFLASLKKSKIKEIGIRYGEKKQVKRSTVYTANVTPEIMKYNGADYPGVLLTYNLSSVQAQKITLDSKDKITAEGNVLIEENGEKREKLKAVELKIVKGAFVIKSMT